MSIPELHYARSGGVAIAYQVVGAGPPVIYAPHLCSIEALWQAPHTRRFLDLLAERVQLIVFNPRGTGLSDRPRGISLESRMDDINAVLDATASPEPPCSESRKAPTCVPSSRPRSRSGASN